MLAVLRQEFLVHVPEGIVVPVESDAVFLAVALGHVGLEAAFPGTFQFDFVIVRLRFDLVAGDGQEQEQNGPD